MSSCNLLEIERLERPNPPFICAPAPEDTKKRLTFSRGELVAMITKELHDRIDQLLACPNVQIFKQERAKVYGEYSALLKAASKIVLTDTDPMVHQSLVQSGISRYESRVRARGDDLFGADVTGELLFCLATMRRTYRLVGLILAKIDYCPDQFSEEDSINAREFSAAVCWSAIHLDCINIAVQAQPPASLPVEVLQEIIKGARFAVTAYAHARLGYNLRYKEAVQESEQTQWDDEDRYLAAVSAEDAATIQE